MAFSFGQPAASTSSAAAPPAFSFGNASQQQQNNGQPATGGGLFGQPQQQQPSNGGLFGAAPKPGGFSFGAPAAPAGQQQASTGGLFGQSNNTTSGTGGLFGGQQNQNQQQQKPQQQTGGLFGASNQPGASGGLFGGGQSSTTGGGGGLFGSSTQQQQPQQQTGTGLFGSTQQQQQQQPSGGLFGGSTQQQPAFGGGGGLFGSTQQAPGGGLFGSTQQAPQQQQQQQQQQQGATSGSQFIVPEPKSLSERLQEIEHRLNPSRSEYIYQDYVYNVIAAPEPGKQHVNYFGMAPERYETAQRNNPDRERLVPVDIKGEASIAQRVKQQAEQQQALREKVLAQISHHLPAAYAEVTGNLSLKAQSLQLSSSDLDSRFVRHVATIAKLSTLLKGKSLTDDEERMHERLRAVSGEYDAAGNGGRMRGKLSEMWALVARVAAERSGQQQQQNGRSGDGLEWDESLLNELEAILTTQTKELSALINLQRDERVDVAILEKGLIQDASSASRRQQGAGVVGVGRR